MDILSFFKWTNEFLALIVAIGGSGATLFGLIYSHLKRQKAEESIAEKLSSIDLQQNEKLQQMDASVQELAVIVTNTQEILYIAKGKAR